MFLAQSSYHNIIYLGNSITSIVNDSDKNVYNVAVSIIVYFKFPVIKCNTFFPLYQMYFILN